MLAEDWEALALAPLLTAVIYAITLLIVRLGSKRLLSRASPFDFVVSIMLGSVMSRAMTGSSPLVPTVLVGATLLLLHWIFASLAYHTTWFGRFVKGKHLILIKDGKLQHEAMKRAQITTKDLEQAVHLETRQKDFSAIEFAYLERNGSISVIQKRPAPRAVSISVEEGVQTVRIEFPE